MHAIERSPIRGIVRRSQQLPFTLLFILALLFSTSSCSKPAPAPAPLHLGLNLWAGYAPFYAAADRGLYSPSRVELATFSAFYDIHRALQQKHLDVAAAPLFDALQMIDNGMDLRIIMVADYSNGADGLIARKSIATIQDLRGKRVAAEFGTLPYFILRKVLERGGVQPSEVVLVNLPADQAAEDFKQGKIDAAELWEPFLSRVRTEDTHVLFTTAETPVEIPDVLIARKEVVEQRHKDLLAVLRAWNKALQIWKTKPDEIEGVMARTMEMTPEELRTGAKGIVLADLASNRDLFDKASQGASIWRVYELSAKLMLKYQLLKRPPRPAQEIIDTRLVAEAAAE
jgi:NitT/TauT family transport system substrate-binding protein